MRGTRRWYVAATLAIVGACAARTGLEIDRPSAHPDGGTGAPKVPCDIEIAPGRDWTTTLVLRPRIRTANLVLALDRTGTMAPELSELREAMALYEALADGLDSLAVYVALVGEYNGSPYATSGQRPLEIAPVAFRDASSLAAALESIPLHTGGDAAEAQIAALYGIATGDALRLDMKVPPCELAADEVGMVCLPRRTARAILLVTDSPFHNAPDGSYPYDPPPLSALPPPSYAEAVTGIREAGFAVLGVSSMPGEPFEHVRTTVEDVGTVSIDGRPAAALASEGALVAAVIDRQRFWLDEVPLTIRLVARLPASLAGLSVTAMPTAITPSEAGLIEGDRAIAVPGSLVTFRLTMVNHASIAGSGGDLGLELRTAEGVVLEELRTSVSIDRIGNACIVGLPR